MLSLSVVSKSKRNYFFLRILEFISVAFLKWLSVHNLDNMGVHVIVRIYINLAMGLCKCYHAVSDNLSYPNDPKYVD